ncbi:MAG: GAF domain-containing protein [Erysipelotrichaceae bacterium]|nr:GAF domain-containing protein [Erysipelotrichaceae bacterium]
MIEKRKTDYQLMINQLKSLSEISPNYIPLLSNASAVIFENMEDLNWAGFYLVDDKDELLLGPFQGKSACVIIPKGKGVCGTAFVEDAVQRVDDVHQFKGHIACDSASNSEIVVPIHHEGKVVGVLDIDSPLFSRFSKADEEGLKDLVKALEELIEW